MTDDAVDGIVYLRREAVALERIATALEQMHLDRLATTSVTFPAAVSWDEPPLPTPPPDLATALTAAIAATVPLPPVQPAPYQFTGPSAFCPVHRVPWKTVPAGTSKRTGAPYSAFLACPERGCNEKPQAPR